MPFQAAFACLDVLKQKINAHLSVYKLRQNEDRWFSS